MKTLMIESVWPEQTEPLCNNHYLCPHCGDEWQSVWHYPIVMDCVACGVQQIAPSQSEQA